MTDEKKMVLDDSHHSSDEATIDGNNVNDNNVNDNNVNDNNVNDNNVNNNINDPEKGASPPASADPNAPKQPDYGPAPDGGWRAWSVAMGAGFITFAALGFANTFGVFQEYYITHQLQHKSADTIAWIGSCTAFFQFLAGSISGPLFDRYGSWLLRPSTVVCVFATMMISLCTEFYQFLLCQGILLGIATGCMQFPAMAAVMQFFDKNRAAALGVAVAGSSVGGVVFPIALSRMLNDPSVAAHLSFGWAVRIIGFVMLFSLGISCVTVRPRLPPRTTQFFLPAAFKQTNFVFIIFAMIFMFMGLFTPLFFLPSYAVTQGMDTALASYLLAIVNAASTFGRIIPGILADRLGRINVLVVGGTATGIIIMCLTKAHSTAGLVVFAVFFGFASGTIVSGASAAISVCSDDPRKMGTYLGMGLGTASIAVLIGPPINGQLVHHYPTYLPMTLFSGIACVVGGAFAFYAKSGTPQGIMGRV
ncbi:hypothetical protein SCUCBS95973_000762 [Sporothrix curviconia]|uniref:Major facilitator superfamily (MFS) profile domain-containing protein n=1 Tax=Sporothrix curviconia TaxID=1260050 RepID=A0ABP0ASZ0_9PEZI